MRKHWIKVFAVLAVITMLASGAIAQQTPASNSGTPPPAKAQTTAPAKAPAAKSAQVNSAAKPPAKAPAAKTMTLTTPKDKQSYAIGMNIGKGLHRDSVDVDPNILAQGVKDALAGGKTQMTDDEAKAALTALQADVTKRQQEQAQVAGEANEKQGEAFLDANKTKEGVVTLPSGLQYKIVTQ